MYAYSARMGYPTTYDDIYVRAGASATYREKDTPRISIVRLSKMALHENARDSSIGIHSISAYIHSLICNIT